MIIATEKVEVGRVGGSSTFAMNMRNLTPMLVVVAIAINFLLISDGSAVLRYST
jgi:hypothetical protein